MKRKANYIRWIKNAVLTKLNRKLFSINLEVTKKCNAHCNFCDYWKTKDEKALTDFLPIVRHFDPISIVLTGGEPLLRDDITEIISSIKSDRPLVRLSMITNGILLKPEIADRLFEAGLDQLSISLDFMDERHDQNRGHRGLFKHICEIAPRIRRRGHNLCLNSVVMRDNFADLDKIVKWTEEIDVGVSFSCYSDVKNKNERHLVRMDEIDRIEIAIDNLIKMEKSLANILNSEFYLKNIPAFFLTGKINGCQAGLKWVQVTPEGDIKRCSEFPIACNWKDYNRDTFKATDCGKCWFACRGESQAPFQLSRLRKYTKILLDNLKHT
jgi:MoaA/NifB/PqqE/SkfB family radical SAM enzyme